MTVSRFILWIDTRPLYPIMTLVLRNYRRRLEHVYGKNKTRTVMLIRSPDRAGTLENDQYIMLAI